MRELKKKVKNLIDDEFIRANEKYPLFVSEHEAAAVLLEELEETEQAVRIIRTCFTSFWDCVKKDDFENMADFLESVYKWSQLAACECIQVGAMAEKSLEVNFRKNKERATE